MPRLSAGALALAAWTGACAWVSLGTIAVLDDRQLRIGTLPPWWVLGVLVALSVIGSRLARLRTSESWPLSVATLCWIPWLPVRLPAVAYLWDGALEWAIWLVAFAGVLFARVRLPQTKWWSHPTRAPQAAAALFAAGSLAAGAAVQTYIPGGDEPHYLVITQSLLRDGDLKIENNHERGDFFDYTSDPIRPDFLSRGRNGEIYSVHAPGVSALVLPAFAVAGYPGALLLVACIGALGCGALWRIAHLVTGSPGGAWAATIAAGFSATAFLHSFTIFPDPVGAAMVTAPLLILARLDLVPSAIAARQLIFAGVCLAFLPWLHTRFALVAVAFGVAILVRLVTVDASTLPISKVRRVAAFSIAPLMSAVAWLAFFYVIYGTPNPSAPYGGSRQTSVEWLPAGLAGLAFDQQFGLLANTPAFALLPWGMWILGRERPRLALELTAIAMPYVLVVGSFGMWWGGWSAPARFLDCLIPLCVPPLAVAWARGRAALRAFFVALVLVGVMNAGARVAMLDGALLYNFRDGFDLLLDWASRTVNLPLALPSIHRLDTEQTLLLGSIYITAAGVILLVLHVLFSRPIQSRGSRWAATSWLVILGGSLAVTASWAAVRTVPLTPESSKIDFVHRWNPERRPTTLRIPAWQAVPAETALGSIQLRSSVRAREMQQHQALLALSGVPAGDYRLVVEGARDLQGTLTVSIGATSQTVERWPLDGLHAGDTPLILQLPARVRSVTILGDELARSSVTRVALRPSRLGSGDSHDRFALRAARYDGVRAFFLDDDLYMEPGGIWTRGGSVGELVAASDGGREIDVQVIAGPVATALEISTGDTTRQVSLAANESRRLQVPPGRWVVRTKGSFRPKDYDAASHDARSLGARLELSAR
jgi:hypothetical protein